VAREDDGAVRLVGVAGSLRKGSLNALLLRALAARMPEGSALAIHGLRGIPLYDGDSEDAEGIPAAVAELKEAIAASDGLVLATPEYNHSVPGVLKNAIDWLSRPPADIRRVFRGRPVAILGASPGRFGTAHSQGAWLPVLRALGTEPWFGGQLLVAQAGDAFESSGEVRDERLGEQLERFARGFAEFAAKRQAARPG
jgi:chromate reductase, NAD(P)H dehydrogenase (quinone)